MSSLGSSLENRRGWNWKPPWFFPPRTWRIETSYYSWSVFVLVGSPRTMAARQLPISFHPWAPDSITAIPNPPSPNLVPASISNIICLDGKTSPSQPVLCKFFSMIRLIYKKKMKFDLLQTMKQSFYFHSLKWFQAHWIWLELR